MQQNISSPVLIFSSLRSFLILSSYLHLILLSRFSPACLLTFVLYNPLTSSSLFPGIIFVPRQTLLKQFPRPPVIFLHVSPNISHCTIFTANFWTILFPCSYTPAKLYFPTGYIKTKHSELHNGKHFRD